MISLDRQHAVLAPGRRATAWFDIGPPAGIRTTPTSPSIRRRWLGLLLEDLPGFLADVRCGRFDFVSGLLEGFFDLNDHRRIPPLKLWRRFELFFGDQKSNGLGTLSVVQNGEVGERDADILLANAEQAADPDCHGRHQTFVVHQQLVDRPDTLTAFADHTGANKISEIALIGRLRSDEGDRSRVGKGH